MRSFSPAESKVNSYPETLHDSQEKETLNAATFITTSLGLQSIPIGPILRSSQGRDNPANSNNPKTMNSRRLQANAGSSHLIPGISSFTVRYRRGEALIIVLLFLVLISALMLSFYSGITDEAASTTAWKNAVTTRKLADSAVYLDIAQIRDATAGFAHNPDGSLDLSTPVGWASQPGAIRTWGTSASNVATYKLYSATSLIDTSGNNPTNDLPSSGWWNKTALYTDLNSPVIKPNQDGTTDTNYPILDPAMTNSVSVSASGGAPAQSLPLVDGFSIDRTASCYYSSNPAAMPVTWLYVLKDGTLIPPDSSSTTTATFSGTKPSSNNPIVGRIAFWTDDETCKLNINTASEGSFWATPSALTLMDVSMTLTPPVNREYNRYPGHPASTSLSPVLGSFLGLANAGAFTGFLPGNPGNGFFLTNRVSSNSFLSSSVTNYYTNLFTNLTPRYVWGGSASGVSNTLLGANPITNLPVSRLYSSVDELVFGTTNRMPVGIGANAAGMTPMNVSQLRFFLTAQSRAPEVNPLNLPKICLWPVPDTNAMTANTQSTQGKTRTVMDQTIAFCSTLGTNGYYFTRYDASGSGNDISKAGAVTGRNKVLYNYLRAMLNSPIPGFKGSFAGNSAGSTVKWNTLQADQICTLVFDYIRSCINLVDSTSLDLKGMTGSSNPYPYSYTTPPTNMVSTQTPTAYGVGYVTNAILQAGSGQVAPIVITNASGNVTKGIGRFPTINRGLLWFVARGADQPPLMVNTNGRPMIFDSSGTKIDNADGTLPLSRLTNLFSQTMANALVYAAANPMHPWTCPPGGSTAPGAGYVTNTILTNRAVTIAGKTMTTALIPNLIRTTNGAFYPVLADSSPATTNKNFMTADINNAYALFPVFDLSCPNANLPTRVYPTLEGSGSYSNGLCASIASGVLFTNSYKPGSESSPTYFYTNYLATNVSFAINAAFTSSNAATIFPITHGGLADLTIQRAQGTLAGSFNIPNPNYKDTLTPALQPHQTRMECVFLPSLVNVAPGAVGYGPNFLCTASNLNSFTVNGANLGFPSSARVALTNNSSQNSRIIGWNQSAVNQNGYGLGISPFVNAQGDGGTNIKWYATNFPVVSSAAPTGEANGATFTFGGGTISLIIATTNSSPIQSISMPFPNAIFPTPKLPPFIRLPGGGNPAVFPPTNIASTSFTTNSSGTVSSVYSFAIAGHEFLTFNQLGTTPWGVNNSNFGLWTIIPNTINDGANLNALLNDLGLGSPLYLSAGIFLPEAGYTSNSFSAPWFSAGYRYAMPFTIEGVEALYGDARLLSSLSNVPSSFFSTNPYYGYSNPVTVNGWPMYVRNGFSIQDQGTYAFGSTAGNLLPSDATASSNNWNYMGSTIGNFNTSYFVSNNPQVSTPSGFDRNKIFMTGSGSTPNTVLPYSVPTCDFNNTTFRAIWKQGGDFDNGMGFYPDGPFIGKVDEGFGMYYTNWQYQSYGIPYYSVLYSPPGKTLMSPNRMVPASLVFGSLPVGFGQMASASAPSSSMLNNSWLTLQFSPNPNAPTTADLATRNARAGYNEAGSPVTNTLPSDHLLLDFFQMPVVEPYPISDPFSTAGKVNMNYQIAPFSHITRDTAMRGVLKSVMITAIDETYAGMYKFPSPSLTFSTSTYPTGTSYNQLASNSGNFYFHYPINVSNTLAQFTNRFGANDLFHSPSEICSLWLYPSRQPSTTYPTNNLLPLNNSAGTPIVYTAGNGLIKGWWYDNPATTRKGLTGDNLRERPYSYIYPRLTTKSNTYQIHYRVQTLIQTRNAHGSGNYATWIDPATGGFTDKVLGEIRGSAVIERYIDSGNPALPDFAAQVATNSANALSTPNTIIDSYYQYRILNSKTFDP